MKSFLTALSLLLAPFSPALGQVLLKPDDTIRMEVFEEADLATRTRILKSGEAVFPLIGSVKLGGLSIEKATERVRELYAKDYLVSPKVTLTVEQYAMEYIDVLGSVTTPGRVPIPQTGQLDVATALASAGGLSANADPDRIDLVRADGSRRTFTAAGIKGDGGTTLKAGDRLLTYESPFSGKTVTLRGQVRKPGPMRFPLDGKLDLLTAISLAGDLTDLANQKKITVTRGQKVTTIDLRTLTSDTSKTFQLQPGDIINVPERIF